MELAIKWKKMIFKQLVSFSLFISKFRISVTLQEIATLAQFGVGKVKPDIFCYKEKFILFLL